MSAKLFTKATIISFDDATESIKTLREHDLLVEGDVITKIEKSITPPKDAEIIDCEGMILSPGFINTHSHLWQTVMRTLAPTTTLAEYFISYSQFSAIPTSLSASDVHLSTLAGYYEGLAGGTTTYVEHGHSNWSVAALEAGYDAACDSGARVVYCGAFEDREGVTIGEGYDALVKRVGNGKDGNGRVKLGLAWDTIGAASEAEINQMTNMISSGPLHALTTHHLGAPWPTADNGPLTLARHNPSLPKDLPIIISHAGLATEEEISTLRANPNIFISITPESEYHFGHGHQTSAAMLHQAALGVDAHFAFSGDVRTQARLFLQTTRNTEFNATLSRGKVPLQNPMSVDDAFLLATRQGALALGREKEIGVLREGAKADIAFFDGMSPAVSGWTNAVAAVVLHASVGDIRHVLVGGEWRKREGELVLPGVEGGWRIFEKRFAEVARRVQGEHPVPQKLGERFLGTGEFGGVEVRAIKQ